ncbi:MAG TPA: glycosyltransferase family 39 protein [Chthoniobacterales bacterium]|nr:glycosyltransferase family 39 protein [Chthoniobacterales bacterium]
MATNLLNARTAWLIAILIAVVHAFLAVTAANTKSPTFDEPQHLTAGFGYWARNDFRLDPETGNLPARWAALPLLFGDTRFVSSSDPNWQHTDAGGTAHQFFYEVGNDPDRMIGQARLMMSTFGAALCLLVYRIARKFFGVIGGLIAEILAAFDPNFLAHSALVTSDVAAAFFFTATIWSCWRLVQKISPLRLTFAALSLCGLFLTKFSAPIVLPALGMMSILQIVSKREIALRFGRFQASITDPWKKAGLICATWVVLGLTMFFAIWLSFSFRYSALTDNGPARKVWNTCWGAILSDHTRIQSTIKFARVHHLLPEAYLCGFAYTQKSAQMRPAFLDGSWSLIGFVSFFPRAFLYKTTLPFLCVILLAVWAAIDRRKRWTLEGLVNPFVLFALVYAAFAIQAQLNIGHRHILPIYPTLFVGCGAVAYLLQQRQRAFFAGTVAICLFWQIGESFAVRPNYLAYFNQIAGGPARGYKHLVDSSLDWGQDLPALRAWIDNHRQVLDEKPLYLSYFGVADPKWYGIDAKRLPENHSFGEQTFAPPRAGVYCVSTTTLQSVYAIEIGQWSRSYEKRYQSALAEVERYRFTASNPSARVALVASDGAVSWVKKIRTFERLRFERLCAYLRHRAPDAQVGYSILVFDLTDKDVDQALYGAPLELTPDVWVAGN